MSMMVTPYWFNAAASAVTGAPQWKGQTVVSGTTLPASIDVAYPTFDGGIVADDVAILWMSGHHALNDYTVTATGFTEVATITNATGLRETVLWKRLSGGEVGNVSIVPSSSSGSTSSSYNAALMIYRGCKNTGNPYETSGTTAHGGSMGAVAAPVRNIASPDRTLLHFYDGYCGANPVPTLTAGSGFTQRVMSSVTNRTSGAVHELAMSVPGYRGETATCSILYTHSARAIWLSLVPQTEVSSSTPSLTDASIGSVVFLANFEGADAGTRILNEITAGSSTKVGTTAETDTAQAKFGSASMRASSGGQTFADSADWALGSGNFTIECWVRYNSVPDAFGHILGQWDTGTSQGSFALSVATNVLTLYRTANGSTQNNVTGSWTPSTNTQYHLAADFDGTTTRIYVDGVVKGTSVSGVTLFNSSAALNIGGILASATQNGTFDGWIDEVRITKGVARYAGAFTPPAAAFPRS